MQLTSTDVVTSWCFGIFCPLTVLVKETQSSVSILLPMLQRIISLSVTLQTWFLF